MNNTSFYQGILYELNKKAEEPMSQAPVQPQPKKKPWYTTGAGMGAIAGGLGLGAAAYGLNHMANKPTNGFFPKPTDFSESPSDSAMGKATQFADRSARGLMNLDHPTQSPILAANALSPLMPVAAKVAPWLNRGLIGLNGASLITDAADPNNQNGAGYKALQAGGGLLDAGSMIAGKNMLQRGIGYAARNPILSRSLGGAASVAPEAIGGRAAGMLLGGPAIAATMVGAAGQAQLGASTQSAEDFVNDSGDKAAYLENNREGLKSMNPEIRDDSLSNLHQWFRSSAGAKYQQDMTSPSGMAAEGGNTHFWKNNAGAGDLATPVYKKLNDRTYHEFMDKIKQLNLREPVYQEPKAPVEQIPNVWDSSPIY